MKTKQIRCAIYCRKSTDENLDSDFNSLDAQRESGEAFIRSQQLEGWVCLPDRYDDPAYSGGNMDRPALKRLLADVEAGLIDAIVVYKVDRLSRRLLDFARIIETFNRQNVSFVSVTQQFSTVSSMGRLTLNILLSFAEFERDLVSERTRDKMAAARRKGKYVGGAPLLGYDVSESKLVVNEAEAKRVRHIFELYTNREALLPVVQELDQCGWRTKGWTTKKGKLRGGTMFNKTSLYQLLTNVAYVGHVRYRKEIHKGEHASIVPPELFQRVQQLLARNGRSGGAEVRTKSEAMLRGLLRCSACDCAMSPSHSTRGGRRYRYYCCQNAAKHGWENCPSPSVPASEIERFVVDQIRGIGRDPAVARQTIAAAQKQVTESLAQIEAETALLKRQLRRDESDLRGLIPATTPAAETRLAELQEQLRTTSQRLAELGIQAEELRGTLVNEDEAIEALGAFDPVWEALSPREQHRVMELLIERVDFDGTGGKVAVVLRPSGIQTFAEEFEGAAA